MYRYNPYTNEIVHLRRNGLAYEPRRARRNREPGPSFWRRLATQWRHSAAADPQPRPTQPVVAREGT
jgi:hypothetical protein